MADILIISPSGNLTGDKTFAGAKARFFATGTTTPATVYADNDLTTPHPSPLLAGADGLWPEVFVGGTSFKVVVTYSDDVTCYTLDPCPKSSALGASASSVSFAPTAELPFNNVQEAIEGAAEGTQGLTATAAEINRVADMPPPPPNHFLAGDPTWNLARGAAEVGNTAFWNGVTNNGITATILATGNGPNGGWVRVRYAGTGTGSSTNFGPYIAANSSTPAVVGAVMTASAIITRESGSAASNGMRVSITEVGVGTPSSSTPIRPATATPITVTRTNTIGGAMGCYVAFIGVTGVAVDEVYLIEGLQFEVGTARTIGRYTHMSPAIARTALDISAQGAPVALTGAVVDFSGIPAHANEVTLTIVGMTRTGVQRPLLQAIVGGAAVTSGYTCTGGVLFGSTPATGQFTTGFGVLNDNSNADVLGITITLNRHGNTNTWRASGKAESVQGAAQAITVQGSIALAGPLTGLRFAGNGATFTAGTGAIQWRV